MTAATADPGRDPEYLAWRERRRAALVAKWANEAPSTEAIAACQRLGRILGGDR